jgi:hypothetical protein
MARKTTNLADLYFSTNAVQHIVTVTYMIPDREPIISESLHDDEPEVLGVGAATAPRTIEVTCSLDSADTTGQGAMLAAFDAKTPIAMTKFYPDGKTTGSEEWSGSVYVTGVPKRGSDSKNKIQQGMFKLVFAAKPTKGVAT